MTPAVSDWSFFAEHRGEILGATVDHMALVVMAMLVAIVIAVPLGMFIVERPALRAASLGSTMEAAMFTAPITASISLREMPPGRRMVGWGVVRSSTVDSMPTRHGPPSRIRSTELPKSDRT